MSPFDLGWYSFIAGLPRPEAEQAADGWDKAESHNKQLRFRAREKKAAREALGMTNATDNKSAANR